MRRAVKNRAALGWFGIAGIVVGYDIWALLSGEETLSAAFWRLKGSRFKVLLLGLWLALTWHLLVGDRHFVKGRSAVIYRRVHPLYVLHDRLIVVARSRDDRSDQGFYTVSM